jgi:hypothetical protein
VLADAGGEQRVIEAEIDADVAERWRTEMPFLADVRVEDRL